jgi:hypothetical protein
LPALRKRTALLSHAEQVDESTVKQTQKNEAGVLYISPREGLLRWITGVCVVPVPLVVWLVSLAPRAEWETTPLGAAAWWVLPAGLIALSGVMPAAMFFLHGRYVLRLERGVDDELRLTTFLVWGRRTVVFTQGSLAGARMAHDEGRFSTGAGVSVNAPSVTVSMLDGRKLIFDEQGEAPHGWHAIEELTKRS